MATKKYKAPAGMHPEDAKDWEKFGTFVHHFEGGGPFLDGDGKPLDLSSYMAKISVLRGSVVYADTDAIVNAANAQLAGGSGVCGAIFEEAGWGDMQQACDRIGGCPTGEAVSTPGFKLKAKYVIHAVGPIYAGRPRDAELLRSAYRSCLEEAEKLGLHSIGLCSISTGIYGYPLNEAVKIAADTLRTFPAKSLTDIRVYCYGEREYQAFTKALG
jgi:O-acetyl-ADP-ribose deacetylase (regulator of RNase III)